MKQDTNDEIRQEIPTDIGRRVWCVYFLCVCFCVGILIVLKISIKEE